jgi:hypothetical protein
MNAAARRARVLAFLLDLAIPAAVADAAALLAAAAAWRVLPAARSWTPWLFGAAGAAVLGAFLFRDARGGRARRWLALEVRDADGGFPGVWRSIRRNLPLLIPVWNLMEAWPILSDGLARRRSDRRLGLAVGIAE